MSLSACEDSAFLAFRARLRSEKLPYLRKFNCSLKLLIHQCGRVERDVMPPEGVSRLFSATAATVRKTNNQKNLIIIILPVTNAKFHAVF